MLKCSAWASVLYKVYLSNSVELEQEVFARPTDGHCFPLSSDSLPRGVPASFVDCVCVCVCVRECECARPFSFNLQLESLCWGKIKRTMEQVQVSAAWILK